MNAYACRILGNVHMEDRLMLGSSVLRMWIVQLAVFQYWASVLCKSGAEPSHPAPAVTDILPHNSRNLLR